MAENLYPEVLVKGSGAIKVATVGDSLTYGYGLNDRNIEAYPSILADKLGSRYQVHNFGLSGRSLQTTSDFPYFEEDNAKLSLLSEPDMVVVMIGSNDSRGPYWNKERFTVEYRQMVERYQSLVSQPDVFVVVPPFVPTSRFGLNNAIIKEELQVIIPQIAEEVGAHSINLYPLTEGHLEYYSDGLHLNYSGNQIIAEEIFSQLIK
ncbi:esterase [Streptococcus sp. X16XC17]|uniref:GDSL-type esterase/lipase family protein n=1 Tax=unclassified Streptococcus TaxID=2608887 RepID=UPI00066FD9BF|nr:MULTISPECIES: GDSL-type esterase/lipase family protein [unclassified Streptococcus]TCD46242.1 esterase [Streptococcus sp. X16XC17]